MLKNYFTLNFSQWLDTLAIYIFPIFALQQGVNQADFEVVLNDYIYFGISIVLASIANVFFFSRDERITFKKVARHLFIAFFVGWVAFLIGKNFHLSFELRLIIVSLMAFLSEFFLKWLSEKYPKIFNRGLNIVLPPNDNKND